MTESFRRVYVSASIEMQAKYKVALLWNPTVVCIPGTLIGYWIVGASFVLGVEKGRRGDKCRLVKMFYLSRGKISKTVKYLGNGKIRKNKKIEERLLLKKNEWTLPSKKETSPITFLGDSYISPACR